MTMGAQTALYQPPADLAASKENLLFTSGGRELRATGIRQRIAISAKHGESSDSAFQQAIGGALDQARKAGHKNPIVIGAIPFDLAESSCLYVPESYEWRDREQPTPLSSPANPTDRPILVGQRSLPDEEGFKRAVRHAIVNFQHSDVRKAVLSVIRELEFSRTVDVDRLLSSLQARNRDGYQFRVPLPDGSDLVGVSPELLIRKDGDRIVSNPLAGSAKRQTDPDEDAASANDLMRSNKDQYEHSLVIQDIKRILQPNCAELTVPERPSLINTAALWHLSTKIEGRVKDPAMTSLQLACQLHPTPAVCGFPTEMAHKLIRFVEPFERGLFTGMVGWCDAEGNGEWVVTIRCGIVKDTSIRLFAGAGIVEASQPASEWAEVQTKLSTMLTACGVSA